MSSKPYAYTHLRRVLHLDGVLGAPPMKRKGKGSKDKDDEAETTKGKKGPREGGRPRADLDFCLALVRRSLPEFTWDFRLPWTARLELALVLPARTMEDIMVLRAVAFLEENDVETAILRAHPTLLDENPLTE